MKKAFTKILGTHVVSDQAEGTISLVTGVHIDPENGKIIALQCGFKQVLAPVDIVEWGRKIIHVNDYTALTTKDELLRLQSIPRSKTNLLYKTVYTKSGERIGYIYDFTIDTTLLELWSISVKRTFLWITMFETLIPRKHILEILEDRIIIKDLHMMEKIGSPITAEPA